MPPLQSGSERKKSETSTLNPGYRAMEWIQIASADDDMIAGEMLEWSGYSELWDEHELGDDYSFVDDVLELCENVFIETEEWDADSPGMSGNWYTITTADPDKLKVEILARIEELIAERE